MQPGDVLGPYRVTAKLGEGGMGAVYRARDTQLGRDVALKVLPDSFLHDPDRVARFTREAQVLASLDHPNVATIYRLERGGTSPIIVMEIVEGATLEARLAQGPLALDEARHVGIQIADALDAAHERGIVHRDLKPSNVVIRPDGGLKVLDFGLAKTLPEMRPGAAAPSMSPTVTGSPATSAGVILGTAPYMSPEQSRGSAVDRRTDIWALGCLLYECLAGRRAFEGPTLTDTLAQILTSDPDWSKLPAATPAGLSALIRRCLRKDLRQRMQSAGDVRLALEEVDGNASSPVERRSSRAAWFVFAGAAVIFAASLALFVSGRSGRRDVVAPTAVRADLVFPAEAPLWFEDGNSLAMSRDGRMMAWVGGTGSTRRLWLRAVAQLEAQALAGTEEALSPFFSPDGEWLGFFTPTVLKKIRISGGTPQTVASVSGRSLAAAWGEDGTIVVAGTEAPLQRISSSGDRGAAATLVPALASGPRRSPVWVPGRQIVLVQQSRTTNSSVRERSVVAMDLASGAETVVMADAAQPAFLPNGDLLFVRGDALFVVAFDADTLSPRGEPRVVISSVRSGANSQLSQYATGGGRLVYSPGQSTTAAKSLSVVEWRGLTGAPRLLISEPGTYRDLRFSPDGQRLAYAAWVPVTADATDLFVYDLQRDLTIRLAGGPTAEWRPVWTHDGRSIVYSDYFGARSSNGIQRIRADGSGQPERLTTSSAMQVPVSISPDGKYLAYQEQERNQPADIWILPMNPAGAPFRFFTSPASETLPVFSPDGRWIAYASDESGANELYIRPFPAADAKWQVSSSGTLDEHAWSRDGGRLFFRAGDGQHVMAATIAVAANGSLAIGRATSVLALQAENYPELGFWGGLALSPDDRGFALAKDASQIAGGRNRVVLMLDWMDAMQRTVTSPAPR
jgi:Tol biopolymer transport system component